MNRVLTNGFFLPSLISTTNYVMIRDSYKMNIKTRNMLQIKNSIYLYLQKEKTN